MSTEETTQKLGPEIYRVQNVIRSYNDRFLLMCGHSLHASRKEEVEHFMATNKCLHCKGNEYTEIHLPHNGILITNGIVQTKLNDEQFEQCLIR